MLVFHHIATDGSSRRILFDELAELYPAMVAGLSSPLPPVEVTYATLAAAQRRRVASAPASEADYWRLRLDPRPPQLELPTDRPRGSAWSSAGATMSIDVGIGLRGAVAALARALDATLFMVLLAAFAETLRRYTREDDIVVGVPIAGRLERTTERVIGPFVNTLPIRLALDTQGSFSDLVRHVRRVCLDAYEHQRLPFEQILELSDAPRTLGHAPLFRFCSRCAMPTQASVVLANSWPPRSMCRPTGQSSISAST